MVKGVEKDRDGVSSEMSTLGADGAGLAGFGASSTPIGLAFLRAIAREYE